MDLNHLIHREGVERLRADHAASAEARAAHAGLAELFRGRIDRRRSRRFDEADRGGADGRLNR